MTYNVVFLEVAVNSVFDCSAEFTAVNKMALFEDFVMIANVANNKQKFRFRMALSCSISDRS